MITYSELYDFCELNLEKGPWIAGGFARRTYYNQPVDDIDIDIFFGSNAQYERCKKFFTSNDIDIETDNAITYTVQHPAGNYLKIQFIRRVWFNTVQDLFNDFDFSISQYAYDGKNFVTGKYALIDQEDKVLRTINIKNETIYPRMMKHLLLGYYPSEELVHYIHSNKDKIEFTMKYFSEYR